MSTPEYLNRFTNSIGISLYFILGYGGTTTSCTSTAFVLFILTGNFLLAVQGKVVMVVDISLLYRYPSKGIGTFLTNPIVIGNFWIVSHFAHYNEQSQVVA
ncbi:unnamed protein product [Rotaria magnacalcarata]